MSRLAVCPAPSHFVPVAKGWGGGRAGGVRPPGLARLVPGGLEEVLPWRRHAPHPLPGPGSRAPCLWFSPHTPHPRPVLRSPTEILHRPLAAQLGTKPGSEMQGLPAAKSPKARWTYPATGSCSQLQGRARGDPSPAPLSSLTTEASPGGRTCLLTSHQPQPRWVSGYRMIVR